MKKVLILLMALVISCGAAGMAHAIEFKAKGIWLMAFQYGQNGNFTSKGHQGYDNNEDNFEASSRTQLQLDAIASENLSSNLFLEIGASTWGKSANGGAMGADSSIVKLKRAYIDWQVPDTPLKLRMGIQGVLSPAYAMDGPTVLAADVGAVTAALRLNDNVGLTAFWVRPYNDNYLSDGDDDDSSYFMDNMDVFSLALTLTFDGVKVTPWGIFATLGPNTVRSSGDYQGNRINVPDGNIFLSGMFPVMANVEGIAKGKSLDHYANAWWAGVTGEVTVLDPFRLAWEATWGGVTWEDDPSLNRSGWMATLILEYRTDWGIPGIYGWYSSGDDDDLGNGSERMPFICNDLGWANYSSYYAGVSLKGIVRDHTMVNTLTGTWGVGFRLKNMTFIENLSHTFHCALIGGTNDPGILKEIHSRTGTWMTPNTTGSATEVGRDNLYLTKKDHVLDIGLDTTWTIYENLEVDLNANYIMLFLDKSDDTWGQALTGGGTCRDLRDAWNIHMLFRYHF